MVSNRRAVVIGINKYKDEKNIVPLAGAVNDATELYEILRDRGDFTIDRERHFLIDENATCERIRGALSDLFWESDGCDTALFYFAGHGRRDYLENGFLVPHDFCVEKPLVCGVDIIELKRHFLRAQVKTSIMILDCCYSGLATKADRGAIDDAIAVESFHKSLEGAGTGKFILASADADKTAREMAQGHFSNPEVEHIHGLFSFNLIEALRGGAKDEAGHVSLEAVIEHLGRNCQSKNYRPQISIASGAGLSEIILAKSADEQGAYIDSKVKLVQDLLEQNEPRKLMYAVKTLHELERRNLYEKRHGLIEMVEKRADIVGGQISDWWGENMIKLASCVNAKGYRVLNDVIYSFRYETIKVLENREFSLVCDCLDDIVKGKPAQKIAEFILRRDQDAQAKLGATGAGKNAPIANSPVTNIPVGVKPSSVLPPVARLQTDTP